MKSKNYSMNISFLVSIIEESAEFLPLREVKLMGILDTNMPIGVKALKLEQQVFIKQAQIELAEASKEALINVTLYQFTFQML
jgi:hypothetical protein